MQQRLLVSHACLDVLCAQNYLSARPAIQGTQWDPVELHALRIALQDSIMI